MSRVKIETTDYFPDVSVREVLPTGCTILDCILGGGWPLGRTVNIVGDKSTGKTLLAIEAVANFKQKFPDSRAVYIETESAFDVPYAQSLGLDMSGVDMIDDCRTVEELFDLVDNLSADKKAKGPTICVIDSLDALSDDREVEQKFGAPSYGMMKAQRLSQFFRRINAVLAKQDFLLVFVSQVRDNIITTQFGKKHKRSGGHALDFYCSQIVWLANKNKISKTIAGVKRYVGITIKINVEKNKMAPPHRSCEVAILFGYGVDDVNASVSWLKEIYGEKVEESLSEIVPDINKVKDLKKAIGDGKCDKDIKASLDKFVKEKWKAIELSFVPKFRKY